MFTVDTSHRVETSGLIVYIPLDGPGQSWQSISLNTCLEDELEPILSGLSDDLILPDEKICYKVVNTEVYRKDNKIKSFQSNSVESFDWVIVVMVVMNVSIGS